MKAYIQRQIRTVAKWLSMPDDEPDFEDYHGGCRRILRLVREYALNHGFPQIAAIAENPGGLRHTRKVLAKCLEVLDRSELLNHQQADDYLGYSASGLRKIVNRTKAGKPGIRFSQVGNGPIKFKREWLDEFTVANLTAPRPKAKPQHWS